MGRGPNFGSEGQRAQEDWLRKSNPDGRHNLHYLKMSPRCYNLYDLKMGPWVTSHQPMTMDPVIGMKVGQNTDESRMEGHQGRKRNDHQGWVHPNR